MCAERVEAVWAADRPDYNAYFEAISAGDLDSTKAALNSNINVNALRGDGMEGETALHIAAGAGHVDIVEFLIANGAIIDIRNRFRDGENTPLLQAAFSCRARVVEILLDNGADIKAVGEMQRTSLLHVLWNVPHVEAKHIEMIELLLDRGHDPYSDNIETGGTILHMAAERGSVELLLTLLKRGINLNTNIRSFYGSVLGAASAHGQCNTAEFLIRHGAKVDKNVLTQASSTEMIEILAPYLENTAILECGGLHAACTWGASRVDRVRLLLNLNFNIEAIDENGDTPLLCSCGSSYATAEVIELLLDHDADVTARTGVAFRRSTTKGDTPLHRAAWRCIPKVVELLLKAGADLAARNDAGQTPLIKYAAKMNGHTAKTPPGDMDPRSQVLNMLIVAGADVAAVDTKNRTALHALALCSEIYGPTPNRFEAAKLLLEAGTVIDAVDSDGRTALDYFSKQKDDGMVGLLTAYPTGQSLQAMVL